MNTNRDQINRNKPQIGTKQTSYTNEPIFVLRSYTKAELAQLYSPGREPASALQNLYRWMRKCTPLIEELQQVGYDKHRHCFLKREVALISKYLGEP